MADRPENRFLEDLKVTLKDLATTSELKEEFDTAISFRIGKLKKVQAKMKEKNPDDIKENREARRLLTSFQEDLDLMKTLKSGLEAFDRFNRSLFKSVEIALIAKKLRVAITGNNQTAFFKAYAELPDGIKTSINLSDIEKIFKMTEKFGSDFINTFPKGRLQLPDLQPLEEAIGDLRKATPKIPRRKFGGEYTDLHEFQRSILLQQEMGVADIKKEIKASIDKIKDNPNGVTVDELNKIKEFIQSSQNKIKDLEASERKEIESLNNTLVLPIELERAIQKKGLSDKEITMIEEILKMDELGKPGTIALFINQKLGASEEDLMHGRYEQNLGNLLIRILYHKDRNTLLEGVHGMSTMLMEVDNIRIETVQEQIKADTINRQRLKEADRNMEEFRTMHNALNELKDECVKITRKLSETTVVSTQPTLQSPAPDKQKEKPKMPATRPPALTFSEGTVGSKPPTRQIRPKLDLTKPPPGPFSQAFVTGGTKDSEHASEQATASKKPPANA